MISRPTLETLVIYTVKVGRSPVREGDTFSIADTGTQKTTRLATFVVLFPQRWTVGLWSWVGNVRALPGVFVGGGPASGACAAASPVLAATQKMVFKRPDVPGAPSSHEKVVFKRPDVPGAPSSHALEGPYGHDRPGGATDGLLL